MPLAHRHHLTISALIASLGLVAGVFVYALAPSPKENPAELTLADKHYTFEMEKVGGKSVVAAQELSDLLSSLCHPPRLGLTIVVASLTTVFLYLRAKANP